MKWSIYLVLIYTHNSLAEYGETILLQNTYPPREEFPGLSIQNLNDFIENFGRCLIHVYNYQGIHLEPFRYPVVLSRYKYMGIWANSRSHLCPIYFESKPTKIMLMRKTMREKCYVHVIDRSTRARWYCQVKFDLFFPDEEEDITLYRYLFRYSSGKQESLSFGLDAFGSATNKGELHFNTLLVFKLSIFVYIRHYRSSGLFLVSCRVLQMLLLR